MLDELELTTALLEEETIVELEEEAGAELEELEELEGNAFSEIIKDIVENSLMGGVKITSSLARF